jgi:hypothetical protein
MNEQLIATLDPARDRVVPPSHVVRRAPRPHAVTAADHLEALLTVTQGGPLERSLLELSQSAGCGVETARLAVASLDPVDHALSVDIRQAPAEERWILAWAPVTGIVDLMLDWDLLTLDISLVELSEWLGVSVVLTGRAVDWLALTPGVVVDRSSHAADAAEDSDAAVRITISLDDCPLTAEARSAAG